MGKVLSERRSETEIRFEQLKGKLGTAKDLIADKACVYVTGSFGRGEASKYSDSLSAWLMMKVVVDCPVSTRFA